MEIYVEKKFSFNKLIPIALLIVMIIIIVFVVRFVTKKEESFSFQPSPVPVPQINYEFLSSPEFTSLEVFPQYSIFIPGESVTPGRPNPFAPISKTKK